MAKVRCADADRKPTTACFVFVSLVLVAAASLLIPVRVESHEIRSPRRQLALDCRTLAVSIVLLLRDGLFMLEGDLIVVYAIKDRKEAYE